MESYIDPSVCVCRFNQFLVSCYATPIVNFCPGCNQAAELEGRLPEPN